MARAILGRGGLLTIAVFLAGCGNEAASVPAPRVAQADPAHRVRVVTPAPEPDERPENGPDAELWAAAAVLDTCREIEDYDERERAVDAAVETLRAAGDWAIPALVAALRGDGAREAAELLGVCSIAAVEPLAAEFVDPGHPSRERVQDALLEVLRNSWMESPGGDAAVAALIACVDAYHGGGDGYSDDEIAEDENRAEFVAEVLDQLWWAPAPAAPYVDDIARIWVRWLEFDADPEARINALRLLTELGTDAAAALPSVLAHVEDLHPDGDELGHVFFFAARVGSACPEALESLYALLDSESAVVRAGAIDALRTWGDAAPGTDGRFARLLDDPDPEVRGAVARALAATPQGASRAWRALLHEAAATSWGSETLRGMLAPAVRDDATWGAMLAAAETLDAEELEQLTWVVREGPPDRAEAWMRRLAEIDHPLARRLAVPGLARVDRPRLQELLGDTDPAVRLEAALATWTLDEPAARDAARSVLVALVRSGDDASQGRALLALHRDPAGPPDAVAEALASLDARIAAALPESWESGYELRRAVGVETDLLAVRLLAASAPLPPERALDAFVVFAAWYGDAAARALEIVAPRALPERVVAAVERARLAADPSRRQGAVVFLVRLPPGEAVPPLAELASDPTAEVAEVALEALADLERKSAGSVPTLLVDTQLGRAELTDTVFELVDALGARARGCADALRGGVVDGAPDARVSAAASLARLGIDRDLAPDVVREFVDRCVASASDLPSGGWRSADDAVEIMRDAPVVAGDLERALASRDRVRARLAVALLARHGPDAAPAVPWLRRVLLGTSESMCGTGADLSYGEVDERDVVIARTLLAIGPAAKAALSELRRVVAYQGDHAGVVRAIIRKLEAME